MNYLYLGLHPRLLNHHFIRLHIKETINCLVILAEVGRQTETLIEEILAGDISNIMITKICIP